MIGILRRPLVVKKSSYRPIWLSSRVTGANARRRTEGRLRRHVQDDELIAYETARYKGGLGEYEDRRRWTPLSEIRPAKGAVSVSHRLKTFRFSQPTTKDIFDEHVKKRRTVERVGFYRPWRVIICARRKMRKEVLHALKRYGRGMSAYKWKKQKPRYNKFSSVICYGG